jgi:hypothetical protein
MESKANTSEGFARARVQAAFSPVLSGSSEGLFVVVYDTPCSKTARRALVKSAEALGYGSDGITFVQTGAAALDAAGLLTVIEGLDPLCLVAADTPSARWCAQAYHVDFPANPRVRIFGREARAFDDLDAMIASDAGKQQVWALLKTLPHFPS